jgi:cellulose synthase/poly-beta-1,6-N-acetylglucosamine synthase-like glycosyltransferase
VSDPIKIAGFVIYGIYVLTSLWLLLNGIIQLHLLWHYKKGRVKKGVTKPLPATLPFVSIQVPVYNERYVIDRLLQALSELEYPKNKFEIQILDDSTDETVAIIDAKAEALRSQEINVEIIRRGNQKGFKAGALEAGLPRCKGELIAIFDADYIPAPSFLKKLIPHFSDPETGLVQARWSHLNPEQNNITRLQTLMLDTHFSIEQTGRLNAGYFINFCGTAGIWRKQCIIEAGGWDDTVLSEDIDLSYRAQLKGWKLVYDQHTEVPAELPSMIESFKTQQFRWTKGMAQISKKTLRTLVGTSLPIAKKLHGIFHLLGSFVFVCLFINALLALPLLLLRAQYPEFIFLTKVTLFNSFNLIALTLFYYHGTKENGSSESNSFWTHYPLFLVVYLGLSMHNAIAVMQGFFGAPSPFVRTPKFNTTSANNNSYLKKRFNWINGLEVGLLIYFLTGIFLSIYLNDYFMVPFFAMISYGLSFIIYQSLGLVQHQKGTFWNRA